MRLLEIEEIVSNSAYEVLRSEYRARVIALKKQRRVAVGDRVTVLFENRETLRFQVQEMLRVERIGEPERIRQELDVYNELVPGEAELSATLFVEIPEAEAIRPELDRLLGIDEHVFLALGEGPDRLRVSAEFDTRQLDEDRISAVHYLRFALSEPARKLFENSEAAASLCIDHPNYTREASLPAGVRASLVADLQCEPGPLLDAREIARLKEPTLAGDQGLRVVRVEGPPVQQTVEARAGEPGIAATVARLARELIRDHGACRIEADLDAQTERWVLTATPRHP